MLVFADQLRRFIAAKGERAPAIFCLHSCLVLDSVEIDGGGFDGGHSLPGCRVNAGGERMMH